MSIGRSRTRERRPPTLHPSIPSPPTDPILPPIPLPRPHAHIAASGSHYPRRPDSSSPATATAAVPGTPAPLRPAMLPPAPRLGPLIALFALLLTPTRGQGGPGPSPNYTRPVFLCGGDVSGESGYVASEGFPNHYPPSKECVWTITVPEGQVVALSFRVFDLELDSTCRYDALEIFAGAGTGGQRLGTFCGTFRPGPVVATGNRVTLRMRADEGTGGRGFLIWYHGRAAHGNGPPPGARRKWGASQFDPRVDWAAWGYWDGE
uniref:CUB domain-containing protein n=1 Tax=Ornithorhynchus anatinus TaxID=9258 RepID=A0A6I8PBN7_ORNAN